MLFIMHKMCHYTIPFLKEGISWLTVTSSNKNQISLLTKTLGSLSHWKNEQFHCSILAIFSNFGFSVVMGSLSSNIFKWSDMCCRLFRIHSTWQLRGFLMHTGLWLWPVGSSTCASHSSSVLSCPLISPFLTSSASPPPSVSNISAPWSHSPPRSNFSTRAVLARQNQYSFLPEMSQPHWELRQLLVLIICFSQPSSPKTWLYFAQGLYPF